MRLIYSLTKKDKSQIFLRQYYTLKKWKYIRIIAGPLSIIFGFIICNAPIKFGLGIGGFFIGFGIYYAIFPFLNLLSRQKSFKEEKITATVDDSQHLILSNTEGVSSSVNLDKIISAVYENAQLNLILQSKPPFSILIPEHCVTHGDLKEFSDFLNEQITKK